jgi:CheY-like chemotaxis protein
MVLSGRRPEAGEMEGIQAAEKIKVADTPVIYMTAYGEEKTLARAKISDPSEYVPKSAESRCMLPPNWLSTSTI